MRALFAALALGACATTPDATQQPGQKSLFVGTVESAKMLGTMDEFRPGEMWLAEVYELKLKVLTVLSGADPGKTATVKVSAHARRFPGMTIVVLSDPDLRLYVPGQSWWSPIRELACLPEDVLKDEAFAKFVEDGFAWDNQRCVDL
jgi:hypothetical protein